MQGPRIINIGEWTEEKKAGMRRKKHYRGRRHINRLMEPIF